MPIKGSKARKGPVRRNHPRFESTRIGAPVDEIADKDDLNDLEAEVSDEASDAELSISSSDDEEETTSAPDPYSTVLQFLNITGDSNGPARKKQKIKHKSADNQDTIESISAVEQPELQPGLPDDLDVKEASEDESDGHNEFEDEAVNESDPFETHFSQPNDVELAKRIELSSQKWRTSKHNHSTGMRLVASLLDPSDEGHFPRAPIKDLGDLSLKRKLSETANTHASHFDAEMKKLAPYVFGYYDILYAARNVSNAAKLRDLYCLHALNHILKTRDRVIKNNSKVPKEGEDLELRDQGFTRPKVLVILPTRQSCVRVMESISKFYNAEQQEIRKRFLDTFSAQSSWENKPDDFKELFDGNDDDMFRIGLKFTRKTVKYFAQFYNSDIILTSPLGLRTAIEKEEGKKLENDFLSSIELVIVDQADTFLMQNWDHVEFIFSHLNLQPKESHGCDFGRVRTWYLDGNAKYLRQTLVLTSFITPEINSLFSHHAKNVSGKLKITPTYPGAILDIPVPIPVKQTFSRFDCLSPMKDPDARFKYFTSTVVSSLAKSSSSSGKSSARGTLIFIPSYLDFVRIRNYFATSLQATNLSFGALSDYTSQKQASRARTNFIRGRHSILLYTERYHHFHRPTIRGVRRVIMYGLPENPTFYSEVVGFLGVDPAAVREAAEKGVRAIFSKWNALKLERIVGSDRLGSMMLEKGGDTFTFA